jgi:succinate dehydrogenase hydrophobic anchor subunit
MARPMGRCWVWWHARRDRRNNLPSPTTKALGDTEQQIVRAYNLRVREAEGRYAGNVDRRKALLAKLVKQRDEVLAPEWDRLVAKTGRMGTLIHIPRAAHWILLTILTLGEMVFNIVAFNVLHEPLWQTWLMALSVGIAVPIGAWFLGLWVRQWPPPAWRTGIKLVVVTAFLLAALVGLNQVRLDYLQAQKAPTAHSDAFFMVNLLVLLAAAIVTYLSHDPEPGFAEAKAKMERREHEIQALNGKLTESRNRLEAEVGMWHEGGAQTISYYRMHNRRGRQEVPKYFEDPDDPNHKPAFESLRIPGEPPANPDSKPVSPPLLVGRTASGNS